MARGSLYTASEDRALIMLYRQHRANWERHVGDYPELAGRSIGSLHFRIYRSLRLASLSPSEPVTPENWPAPGVRIFFDDPRAIRDHGSPGRVTPALNRSMSGSSAAWAAQL